MPSYDNVRVSEKTPIIFDIGTACVKCGFAGESSPRFMLPSPFEQVDIKTVDVVEILKELIHRLCYRYLIVNPKDCRFVIIESLMTPAPFKAALAKILFMHFEVLSILFAPAHVVSLFTLGVSTALVLDCGHSEALVLPVFEGYTILGAWQSSPLGSRYIHGQLEEQILRSAYFVEDSSPEKQYIDNDTKLSVRLLEDIKIRACFVSPSERAALWNNWRLLTNEGRIENKNAPIPEYAVEYFKFPLSNEDGCRCLRIPSRIRETAIEGLFTSGTDNANIPNMLLDAVLLSPIDCRKPLLQNIVCIGGTCMIPGFKHRLNEELKNALQLPRYASLGALKDDIKFHDPPSKPNYTAWLGGSIFGALESLPGRSFNRADYLAHQPLPDWSETQPKFETDSTEGQDFLHTR